MSIIDVLTKWALDKLDEKVFVKKDVSKETRLEELYVFMEQMPNVCEDIADEIHRLAGDSDNELKELSASDASVVVILKDMHWNGEVKEECTKISKFRKKTYPKIAKPIVQNIHRLKFDFDKKKNYRGMAEDILKQLWRFEVSLKLIEMRLAEYQGAIEAEDEGAYLDRKQSLCDIENKFKQHAESFKALVDRILEFSK